MRKYAFFLWQTQPRCCVQATWPAMTHGWFVGHFKPQLNHSADSTRVLLIWRVAQRYYCNHSYVLEIATSIQVLYGCLSLCVELMLSLSQTRLLLMADPRGWTLPCHFRRACLPAMICCSSCSTSLPKFPEEQIIRTSLDFVHFRHTKFSSS